MLIALGVVIAVIAVFVLRKRDIVTHDPLAGASAGPAPAGVDVAAVTKDILAHMEKGQTIEAIKLYRQATGCDLLTAKNFIEKMAQLGSMPEGGLAPIVPAALAPDSPELNEVRALVKAGQLIDAIKRYRAASGCGLYEAKQAVDRIAAEP